MNSRLSLISVIRDDSRLLFFWFEWSDTDSQTKNDTLNLLVVTRDDLRFYARNTENGISIQMKRKRRRNKFNK